MTKKFNLRYSFNMISYFAMFSSMFSFVSVYLLDKGYANSTIGTLLAVTGIFAILLQTSTANFLDKYPTFRLQNALTLHILIILFGSILLFIVPSEFFISLLILIIFSFAQAAETLVNALAFIFEKFGVTINYGFGRGMGSLAFALTTMIVGNIVNQTSPEIIPVFYILFSFLLLLAVRSFHHPKEKQLAVSNVSAEDSAINQSLIHFIRQYKRLLLVMVGIGFLMFMHILVNNFFIQILLPIGGTSATMGNALFLGAILELPAMLNYKQIEKRSSASTLLKISALFLVAKHLITYFATNMLMIYFAQVIQIGAFALMYPAGVSYVHSVVAKKDLVKGQALFTSSMALSSIAGNLLGGLLLDGIGVSQTLLIGVIATIIGAGIVFAASKTEQ